LFVNKAAQPEQLARIAQRKVKVGIVGMGHVGLPLALLFSNRGFKTLGFDTDIIKVDLLNRGRSYLSHIDDGRVAFARQLEEAHGGELGSFAVTVDLNRLSEMDVIIIAVPTPLTRQREPDLRYVIQTCERICAQLREGQLVVLESTTYPGTTDGPVREILERSGLQCGEGIYLAFSPEREDPGNPAYQTASIPKVVGGVDPVSGELATTLYAQVITQVVRVSSARVAEASKLTENIFRVVNIALMNELKVIYERMGIDIWDVLDAAATKPFGFMRFNPGPGVGGHCIPLDPFYLSWKAREHGIATRFIELAGQINMAMPRYVLQRVQQALNDQELPLRGSLCLILGIAYKRDVSDHRESPAFELWDLLLQHGVTVLYHDPYIPEIPLMRSWPELEGERSVPLTSERLRRCDCVILITDHSKVDYKLVACHARLIVDTRGVYRSLPHGLCQSTDVHVVKA
jgi:UDP-N-acetyl-D-glucosamine dehydrogenase